MRRLTILLLIVATGCYSTGHHRHHHDLGHAIEGGIFLGAVAVTVTALAVKGVVNLVRNVGDGGDERPARAKMTRTEKDLARHWREVRDRRMGR